MNDTNYRYALCELRGLIASPYDTRSRENAMYSHAYSALAYAAFPSLAAHHARLAAREAAALMQEWKRSHDQAIARAAMQGYSFSDIQTRRFYSEDGAWRSLDKW